MLFYHKIFIIKKFIKKFTTTPVQKNFFSGYSINISNTQQNNIQHGIEQINKEINLERNCQIDLRKTEKV